MSARTLERLPRDHLAHLPLVPAGGQLLARGSVRRRWQRLRVRRPTVFSLLGGALPPPPRPLRGVQQVDADARQGSSEVPRVPRRRSGTGATRGDLRALPMQGSADAHTPDL